MLNRNYTHNFFVLVGLLATTCLTSCKKEQQNIIPDTHQHNIKNEPEIFLSPANMQAKSYYLLVLNNDGDTLKIKQFDQLVTDFRRWEYDGKVRYSYFLHEPSFYKIPGVAYQPGYRVITDTLFNELKRIQLISHKNIDATNRPGLETHDFLLLSDNHYITQSYYEVTPDNIPAFLNPAHGVKVVAPVLQEIVNDRVVWQWVGTDYPELYETSIERNEFFDTSKTHDYIHANSISIDPNDNHIIISIRNSNQILKLDRKTGDIIWKLGGKNSDFDIPEGMQFLRQHFAHMINNGKTLLLLDNGEINERAYSRVLEFDLNQAAMQITNYRSFYVPGTFIRFAGSVQKFDSRYFIGGGSASYALEVDIESKEKLVQINHPSGSTSYRAYKYE